MLNIYDLDKKIILLLDLKSIFNVYCAIPKLSDLIHSSLAIYKLDDNYKIKYPLILEIDEMIKQYQLS